MELYLIRNKKLGIYFICKNEPFFYGFTDFEKAEQFCNKHADTVIETQEILEEEDNAYLMECLYQQGYKGGYIDNTFQTINQSNPKLIQFIPENASLLHMILYRETKRTILLKNQRFYFFAMITEQGYLAFANTNGYIFGFTDMDNVNTKLAKQLYKMGYEVVKYYLDEKHKYLINPKTPTQVIFHENFEIVESPV
jgi:hypothetical protein